MVPRDYEGETIGDLPISGIINTIELPNLATASSEEDVDIPNDTETTVLTINATGKMVRAAIWTSHDDVEIRIYIDGTMIPRCCLLGAAILTAHYLNALGYTDSTPQIQLIQYQDNLPCDFTLTLPFGFKRQLQFRAWQNTGVPKIASIGTVYNKLT